MKRSHVAAARLLVALADDPSKLSEEIRRTAEIPLDSPELNRSASKRRDEGDE